MEDFPRIISSASGWEAEIFKNWSIPPELNDQWEAWSQNHGDIGIYVEPGWFERWWNAYGRGASLLIVVLREHGKPKALFPLYLEAKDGNGRSGPVVRSLTNSHSCYFGI